MLLALFLKKARLMEEATLMPLHDGNEFSRSETHLGKVIWPNRIELEVLRLSA